MVGVTFWKHNCASYLHGDTHRVAEVHDTEGDDGEPLLPGEGRHAGGVLGETLSLGTLGHFVKLG